MEVVCKRCCRLDVHKKTVVAAQTPQGDYQLDELGRQQRTAGSRANTPRTVQRDPLRRPFSARKA